jgi:hypothetical protein
MSCVHSTQIPSSAGPEQIGLLFEHAADKGSQTQVLLTQALLLPVHSLSLRQPGAQLLLAAQYSPVGQFVSCVHSTQMPSPGSPKQTGVSPEQTSPVPPGSQTQLPVTQRLLFPVHSLSTRQPGLQVLPAVQYCVSGQSVFCVHATQMLVVVLQTGVVPSQSMFWAHSTHTALVFPLAPRQTGIPAAHVLPELPQTQTWSRQRLLVPVHSLSVRQPAAHVLLLVQYCPAGQVLSCVQATQVYVAVLQTGVVPLQSPFCVHATHVFVCVLQTAVVPPQ